MHGIPWLVEDREVFDSDLAPTIARSCIQTDLSSIKLTDVRSSRGSSTLTLHCKMSYTTACPVEHPCLTGIYIRRVKVNVMMVKLSCSILVLLIRRYQIYISTIFLNFMVSITPCCCHYKCKPSIKQL